MRDGGGQGDVLDPLDPPGSAALALSGSLYLARSILTFKRLSLRISQLHRGIIAAVDEKRVSMATVAKRSRRRDARGALMSGGNASARVNKDAAPGQGWGLTAGVFVDSVSVGIAAAVTRPSRHLLC